MEIKTSKKKCKKNFIKKNKFIFFLDSLIIKYRNDYRNYHWEHIYKLKKNPPMFTPEISPAEVSQGNLPNCYLISSISAIAEFPETVIRLFNTKKGNSQGLFSVNLCINGKFKEVIVDGHIPVDEKNQIKFADSDKTMWPLILEKALAKVYGGYWNIGGAGVPCRALKDLTGAPTEFLKFDDLTDSDLFEKILEADENEFIMVAPTNNEVNLVETNLGMVPWHAYTVLTAMKISGEMVVKLRNPHGKGEWRGDWSDNSFKWTKELRDEYDAHVKEDGIFFMPIKNFKRNFQEVDICHYNPENILTQRPIDQDDMDGLKSWVIKIPEEGEYYISLSQPDERYPKIDKMVYMSMIMFRNVGGKLKYVGGIEHCERDPFFISELVKGEYLLIVKNIFFSIFF